ncbi:MAG: LysR family transcriptional regulator [Pseudomonadota bacterium]
MDKLNYHHLRYFWATAHEGNLTRTAERLHVTQSALSVQIRKLEERLGHPLFERRGRQLLLTEAGRIALDHADQIFAAGDELVATLRDASNPRSVLRVGALATLSRNFQIDFLRPILKRPDVEVVLRSGSVADLIRALESLSLDIMLTNQVPLDDAMTPLVAHRLAEQQISLIGTPERLGSNPPMEIPAILATHPIILPTTGSSIRSSFDALADRLDVEPIIAAEVDDMAMMRLLAREDVGLGVLPAIVVKDELTSGRLVQALSLPDMAEAFYAVTIERRFPNPLIAEVLNTQD